MGLSFHYSGSIASPELLPELIEEVLDIARIYGWKNSIYETSFPNNSLSGIDDYNDEIFGVSITPSGCEMFKHLNNRYFSGFKLSDEGQYWETNDEEILKSNFAKYDAILDSFHLGLETLPMKADESFEDYLMRLFELIEKRNKNNK